MTEEFENIIKIRRFCTSVAEELFRAQSEEECAEKTEEFFRALSFKDIRQRALRLYIAADIYIRAAGFLSSLGVTPEEFTKRLGTAESLEKTARSAEKTMRFISDAAAYCVSKNAESNPRITSEPIRRAKDYIDEKYSQDDLSLKTVAAKMNFTPAYFSMLFKKETGVNFSDYLTKVRINKAKELLGGTTKMIYEVANEVGYRDYRYFGQIFKKHTGKTPREYQLSEKKNFRA